ncbi:MAG: tetratricopeptide repeat protein [Candidatus Erginobacter occultus]|nr:tetratricopeptide repeat protein [Candidatus Erginobacter occultus]
MKRLRFAAAFGLGSAAICLVLPPISPGAERPAPTPAPSPIINRLRLQREILDLKIRAAQDPGAASSVREQLARIHLETGEPEKAVTLYRQAIIFDRPRAASYHRKIARIYRDQGRTEEAEEESRREAAAAPESAADRRRRQLAAWEEEGKDDLLLQQYRFLYWTRTGSGDRYLKNIARLLAGRGEEEESERYYRLLIADHLQRIEERPSSAVNYHLRIAGIYREMGDLESAAGEFRRAVEVEGEAGGRALIAEADFYRSRGEAERALGLYRESLSRPGVNQTSLQFRIAALLERAGEEEAAFLELQKAAELEEGGGEEARTRIARLYERSGDLESALAEYRSLLDDLDPLRRARTWERIGSLLSRLDREEEASPAYGKALRLRTEELGEESPDALFLERALSLAEKGGLGEQAEEYSRQLAENYRDLLDRDPGRADYYHRKLGDILMRQEDFHQAAAHYRTWSGLAPSDPAPHYRLYRIYRDHLENPSRAELHLERYRELRNQE